MVNVTAEIHPPAEQIKTRKVFAFGFVKVKLGAGQASHPAAQQQPADELRVLGLLVVEDQEHPAE